LIGPSSHGGNNKQIYAYCQAPIVYGPPLLTAHRSLSDASASAKNRMAHAR
jgi:hypothetical protein